MPLQGAVRASNYGLIRHTLLEHVARRRLTNVPTLTLRNSESLDFHYVAVPELLDALIDAFEAGRKYEAR